MHQLPSVAFITGDALWNKCATSSLHNACHHGEALQLLELAQRDLELNLLNNVNGPYIWHSHNVLLEPSIIDLVWIDPEFIGANLLCVITASWYNSDHTILWWIMSVKLESNLTCGFPWVDEDANLFINALAKVISIYPHSFFDAESVHTISTHLEQDLEQLWIDHAL